jgi:hypothetical protein
MTNRNVSTIDDSKLRANSAVSRSYGCYVSLLLPIILFVVSVYIRPAMYSDSGFGFLVLRSMLEGGPFNYVTGPDPANIANDIAAFQTWWSPGQYLVPGAFVWLGANYGLALPLTTLISIVAGVIGWAQLARSYGVTPFVLVVFLAGLVTFRYATLPFRIYNGGEVLLFAAAPWCVYWLRYAIDGRPAACFAISLLLAVLLFLAKLTGVVVFASNVLAIALSKMARERRLTSSLFAMLAASGIAAILFLLFWIGRGEVPAGGSGFAVSWPAIWFPVASAVFSGVATFDLLSWLFLNPSAPILSQDAMIRFISYALGPLGLLLMFWVWYRLRSTHYRAAAIDAFTIIALYTTALIAMYVRQSDVSFDERHLRYAGILFFLLLLVALDQWRSLVAKSFAVIGVGAFALYGISSYANGARELMRGDYYDPFSGTSQQIVSPVVLEHLRSEMVRHKWQRAIAVLPSPEAAISLPQFHIIAIHLDFTPIDRIAGQRWLGRAEKIFVIAQERMVDNGKAEALLKSFTDYDYDKWATDRIDKMVIYSQ